MEDPCEHQHLAIENLGEIRDPGWLLVIESNWSLMIDHVRWLSMVECQYPRVNTHGENPS